MSEEKQISQEQAEEPKEIKTSFKTIEEAITIINELKLDLYRKNKLRRQALERVKELEAELNTIKASEETLRAELDKLKTIEGKYKDIETARRNELLERLPEDKRESYKDLDLNLLDKITKDFVTTKPSESLGTEGSNVKVDNVISYEQMTTEQINDLAVKDPQKLNQLYKDFLVRKTKGV